MPYELSALSIAMEWLLYPPAMAFPATAVETLCRAGADNPAAALDLAARYQRQGRYEDALVTLDRVVGSTPDVLSVRIQLLTQLRRPELADAALAALADQNPAAAAASRGVMLLEQGRPVDAAFHLTSAMTDGFAPLWVAQAALRACEDSNQPRRFLDVLPRVPQALLCTAAGLDVQIRALAAAGRTAEAAALLDLDRFLHLGDLGPALEQRWGPGALAALCRSVAGRAGFEYAPAGKSTRGGVQTSYLLSGDHAMVEHLLELIKVEVECYQPQSAADHPLWASRPKRAVLSAWAVMLDDGGYQGEHIHPAGWISGVVYLSDEGEAAVAPDCIAGVLEFPELDQDNWSVRRIRPKPGRLALFPSYARHSTQPHCGAAPRVCIAFDVVPA